MKVRSTTKKKSRHKITFLDDVDLIVAMYGELGWHTKAIAKETRMTECKVQYRLHKAQIKRKDYRNGKSAISQQVVESVGGLIMNDLRKTLPPQFV